MALAAMTLANAMVLVDQTAVPLALPSVMQDLGVGTQKAQWVVNASLLPLAAFLVLGGRLGDLFGHRRIFLVGITTFTVASACGGFAPSYEVLIAFRVLQGLGGALMLPTTVAIVSARYPGEQRGRALGVMGGAAAVAGALGPVIGGVLTSLFDWRAVLLINIPLALVAVLATLRSVPRDAPSTESHHVDWLGATLLAFTLIGVIGGVTQSETVTWSSPSVSFPLIVAVAAGTALVFVERRAQRPLMDLSLLRRHRNYLGATLSQGLAGMAEMGLGILFPLLLVLNLGMNPGLAGLALLPASLPMIFVAPAAGRWYDRVGGRIPLVTGFGALAAAGLVLAVAVHGNAYWLLLPGFFIYGVGLALVLTVNDPVSLDQVDPSNHGQASGVSATAEQFGGALGIALLYLVFHTVAVQRLYSNVDTSSLPDLTSSQYLQLRDDIVSAEQTGLQPRSFDPQFVDYIDDIIDASNWGMTAAFLAVTVLSVGAMALMLYFVRRPDRATEAVDDQPRP